VERVGYELAGADGEADVIVECSDRIWYCRIDGHVQRCASIDDVVARIRHRAAAGSATEGKRP
jgi:hypothetical protein